MFSITENRIKDVMVKIRTLFAKVYKAKWMKGIVNIKMVLGEDGVS